MSTPVDLTFKQNGAPFWDFAHWQGNPSNKARQVQFLDRPHSVFGSKRVFRAECIQGDNWPQSSGSSAPRCLVGAWTGTSSWYSGPTIPWPKEGERYIRSVAIEVLPGVKCIGTLWEMHQSNGLSAIGRVAPLSLNGDTAGNLYARLCGGQASGGNWPTYWNLLRIAPATPGVHMVVFDVKYSRGSDGYLDVYHALDQDTTFNRVVSQHTGQPTWPWAPGYEAEKLYQETGIYPDGSVPPDTNAVCHYGGLAWFNAVDADLSAAFHSFELDGGTTSPLRPINTAKPVVSGTLLVGKNLYVSDGAWDGGPTSFAYQWQFSRDAGVTWQNVNGATANTFVCSDTFLGCPIRASVTATNGGGNSTATSDATAPVAAEPPVPPQTPQELRDQAVEHLHKTTVGYVNKHWTVPPDGTEWKTALDLLAKI